MKQLLLLGLILFPCLYGIKAQQLFNESLFKVGTTWTYTGEVYKTAYTVETNHDTSYNIRFDLKVTRVHRLSADTTVVWLNQFFDNMVFERGGVRERVLIFAPNTIYINQFQVASDSIIIHRSGVIPRFFDILFTKSKSLTGINKGLNEEFIYSGRQVEQALDFIKGAPVKKTKLMTLEYGNKKADISAAYSGELGFWNYVFEFSGGKAVAGNFQLESMVIGKSN